MNRQLPVFTYAIVVIASVSLSISAQKKPDAVTLSIAKIVKAKTEVRGYVSDIKVKFSSKPDSPELAQAKAKYRTALGDYNAWVAIVKSAIANGKTQDIQSDTTYSELGEKAGKEANDFVSYAQSQTGQSKGIIVVFSGLIDVGFKIWNGISDRKAKERKERSEQFEKDCIWSQWEDIK